MNFVTYWPFAVGTSKTKAAFYLFLTVLLSIYLAGCGDQVRLPSAEQLAKFESAGPIRPTVDLDRLVRARIEVGLYRVVPGDVLELTMPTVLQVVMAERLDVPERVSPFTPYMCRVSESGTVTLPIVGEINVAGKSLGEIESAIIDAYHPKYIGTRPSVLARVAEYKTAMVSISGAVTNPGVYELRSNQMSLVALLMKAGGIVDEGAALIRITRPDDANPDNKGSSADSFKKTFGEERQLTTGDFRQQMIKKSDEPKEFADENINSNAKLNGSDSKQNSISNEALENELLELLEAVKSLKAEKTAELGRRKRPEPIVLPVRGFNIPFADVALQDGDSVEVERLELPLVTVLGLVNKPGNFPYPPDVQYNLMQALGFAGGLDRTAEPRYATVYRLDADGEIVRAAFKIVDNSKLTDALSMPIKPGDIVAVEQTPRTRTKVFLDRVFRINFGVYAPIRLFQSER